MLVPNRWLWLRISFVTAITFVSFSLTKAWNVFELIYLLFSLWKLWEGSRIHTYCLCDKLGVLLRCSLRKALGVGVSNRPGKLSRDRINKKEGYLINVLGWQKPLKLANLIVDTFALIFIQDEFNGSGRLYHLESSRTCMILSFTRRCTWCYQTCSTN